MITATYKIPQLLILDPNKANNQSDEKKNGTLTIQ